MCALTSEWHFLAHSVDCRPTRCAVAPDEGERNFRSVLLRLPCSLVPTIAVLGSLAFSACATLPNGRAWGQDATATPAWQKVRAAAVNAVESPRFWVPLAGAAVLQMNGWDRRASNWARGHTPIFGSEQNAAHWSDRLRSASSIAYFATVVATPSGDDPAQWTLDKVRGIAVGFAAVGITDWESAALKKAASRERPNGQDDQSMPSSHASRSAVFTSLAERNVRAINLRDTTRAVLDFSLDALTYGTAWARVESGFHYPSDTLVGIALGNFNGAFFNDAFVGLATPNRISFAVLPLLRGAQVCIQVSLY
jgi:membrane-associated phospholipid phosphatase